MRISIAQISAKLTTVQTTYVSLAIKTPQLRKTTIAQLVSKMPRYLTDQWVFASVKLAFIMDLKPTDVKNVTSFAILAQARPPLNAINARKIGRGGTVNVNRIAAASTTPSI
jgi:hypothetical protein